MQLEHLEVEEFREFLEGHPLRSFMQTPEIGRVREMNGWTVEYLGLKEKGKIVAGTMLLSKKRHFGKKEFYALRGPLLDYEDPKMVSCFFSLLKEYVRKNAGYILRIDPYLVYQSRNGAGEVVPGVDHRSCVKQLVSLGFRKVKEEDQEQVSFMYVLDLEGKSEEEILKNMKPNTRNTIRKTLKNGIEIKELTRDELTIFLKIMEETGKRKGFAIRDLTYYQHMYDVFHDRGEIKYLVTTLNLKHHIELLEKEKEEAIADKEKLSDAKYNDGKRKSFDTTIKSLEKRIAQAQEILEKDGEEITLSGSMFVMTQPEIIYLSSGNYEEYMMYNSQYLIQWEMIKYGIEHHYKRYNFYGIPSSFDKNDKDYGIYEFKTGFNGYVEQLIGEYEMCTSFVYYLIKLLRKLK